MIFLYILLGLLAVITFILLTNISVFVKMVDDDIYLKVGAYGIYYWILNPNLEKNEKSKDDKKKEGKVSTNKKDSVENSKEHKKQQIKKSKNSFLDLLKNEKGKFDIKKSVSLFFDIAKVAFPMIKNLIVKMKIKDFKLQMSIGAENAHKTAIQYATIGNSIQILVRYLNALKFVKIKKMNIVPDFVTGEIRYNISFYIKIRVGTVIFEALKALIKFVINHIKKQNENKKGSVNDVFRKSSERPNGQCNGQDKTNG